MAQVAQPAGTGFSGGIYMKLPDGTYQVLFDANGVPVGGSSSQSLSGAGAISVTTAVTRLTTTGANALTLADGTDGQVKTIVMAVDGGDGTLIPTTRNGYASIVFNDVGDSVSLMFMTTVGWTILSSNGVTIS